ncbi:MAG: 30S ribosomal protein S13, partial [Candidatus Nanohaloarchaea archaeon]
MPETREVVRIARTDIDGTKPIANAIRSLQGVGDMYGNAVAQVLEFDTDTKIGSLSDEEI